LKEYFEKNPITYKIINEILVVFLKALK